MTAQLCQVYSWSGSATGPSTETASTWAFTLPAKVGAGNRIILTVSYSTTTAPTITDNNGNSWTGTLAVTSTSGSIDTTIWDLKNANAGTTRITITFGSAQQPVLGECHEWSGLSTTLGNSGTHQTPNAVGPSLTVGSFTPTDNSGNGGNLILAFFYDAFGSGDIGPTSFSPGGSFALVQANVVNTTSGSANGLPCASEFFVQTGTAAPINPSMTANGDSATFYNRVAIALPLTSGAGTPPPTTGIIIAKLLKQTSKNQNGATTIPLQFPTLGNLRVLMSNSANHAELTSVTDSESNTWTDVSQDATTPAVYYFKNAAANANLTVTLHSTALSVNIDVVFFDIANAATGTVVGATAFADATTAGGTGAQQHKPDIPTPTSITSLITVAATNGLGPTFTITAPSGALIANVALGGTGSGESDAGTVNAGDAFGYLYNTSLAAQNWSWTMSTDPSSGLGATAIEWLAAPASGGGAAPQPFGVIGMASCEW